MKKKVAQMSQEEFINKIIRRIYNRGKRKGYVSPEYIEKTVKNKDIPREKIEERSILGAMINNFNLLKKNDEVLAEIHISNNELSILRDNIIEIILLIK